MSCVYRNYALLKYSIISINHEQKRGDEADGLGWGWVFEIIEHCVPAIVKQYPQSFS